MNNEPGTKFAVLDDTITVLSNDAGSGGSFEVFELDGPRDSGPPPHAHPWAEAYYVLDGSLAISIEGTDRVLRAGEYAVVAPNSLHTFKVLADRCRTLVITSGGGASTFFADVDANVDPKTPLVDSFPTVVAVAKRNGVTSPLF